ncbi:MAG: hypothetical protein FJ042_07260 [Candidatus Cloacimonetes bacterium]|nr:hypothetical protein [Candidatus Cloacimonadota bacterium]
MTANKSGVVIETLTAFDRVWGYEAKEKRTKVKDQQPGQSVDQLECVTHQSLYVK